MPPASSYSTVASPNYQSGEYVITHGLVSWVSADVAYPSLLKLDLV